MVVGQNAGSVLRRMPRVFVCDEARGLDALGREKIAQSWRVLLDTLPCIKAGWAVGSYINGNEYVDGLLCRFVGTRHARFQPGGNPL